MINKSFFAAGLSMLLLLPGCFQQETLRIGFIGGLTGSNADNGQAGLNGAMLAVEQFNQAGGWHGRKLELVVRDDAQELRTAEKSARELVAADVKAVIGPFTSSMASATVPITGASGIFQISPTVTAMQFYGKDDNFFRINRTTRDNAREYAEVLVGRGQKKVSVAYDISNKAFTESWLEEFKKFIASSGGQIVVSIPYAPSSEGYKSTVEDMLRAQPDVLFFISGALDVPRFAQQARKIKPSMPMAAAEWAGTEQLLEFGGDVIEGLLIVQNHNSTDDSEKFRLFTESYFRRFQKMPGYSSVMAYDAAAVVLSALRDRRKGESVKEAVLRIRRFEGLQQEIVFDRNGDTERKVFFTEIRGGRYIQIKGR